MINFSAFADELVKIASKTEEKSVRHGRGIGGIAGLPLGFGAGMELARRGKMGKPGRFLSAATGGSLGFLAGRAAGGAIVKGRHRDLLHEAHREFVEANE